MALTVPAFFVVGLTAGSWGLRNYGLAVMTSCSLDNLLFSRRTRAPSLFSSSGFHHLFSVLTLGFLAHCRHSPGSWVLYSCRACGASSKRLLLQPHVPMALAGSALPLLQSVFYLRSPALRLEIELQKYYFHGLCLLDATRRPRHYS